MGCVLMTHEEVTRVYNDGWDYQANMEHGAHVLWNVNARGYDSVRPMPHLSDGGKRWYAVSVLTRE